MEELWEGWQDALSESAKYRGSFYEVAEKVNVSYIAKIEGSEK